MTDEERSPSRVDYSSGLTRRLAEEAGSLIGETGLNPEQIEEQFAALDHETLSSLKSARQQQDALAGLEELVSASGESLSGRGGTFKLSLSDDEMFLSVSIAPPKGGGEAVTTEMIVKQLRDMGIQEGVLLDAINKAVQIAQKRGEVQDHVIVRGRPPEAASESCPVFYARKFEGEIQQADPEQLTNLSASAMFCQAGDVICIIQPGREGRAGYTASGKRLEPPLAKPLELEAGDNVKFQHGQFEAQIGGVVVLSDNRLAVQKSLVINRDADRSQSPIRYDGSIYIRGGVHSGVEIEATEQVVIDKVVESATIISKQGDVILRAGITGRGKGRIVAGRDVKSGFVENASVLAGRHIILGTGALNSHLTATEDILAEVGKGGIAGGVLIAGNCVRAKQIGSAGTGTTLIIGIGPRDIPKLNEISHAVAECQKRLKGTTDLIAQFERAVRDPSKLTQEELAAFTRVRKLSILTEHKLQALESARREALEASVAHTDGKVVIHKQLGPQVVFHFGAMKHSHPEAKGPLTIGFDIKNNRIAYHTR